MSPQRIEVHNSKFQLFLLLLGAIAFVAIGFWFIIDPPSIRNLVLGKRIFLAIIGGAAIIFFSICGFFVIKKFSDKTPVLVIDNTGIANNAPGLMSGFIPWSDIEGFSVIKIHRTRLIRLQIKNPEAFIRREPSMYKKDAMEANYKMYGTPVCLSAAGLTVGVEELMEILEKVKNVRRET